jgi:hypothetical protein
MKLSTLSLTLTLPCVLAMSGVAQWRDGKQIKNTVVTTLTEVRAHPDAFRNVKVQFDIQFAILGAISNPFFTQFVPTDFANFHGWAVEQPIWQKGSFDDVFGLLFISKSSEQLQDIYATTTFQRMRVTGLVRNTFQNQPWIEVTTFERLPDQVEWATLGHLYRADQWMAQRQWQQALSELSLASQAKNPGDVDAHVYQSMGVCYLRMGEANRALAQLEQAKKLRPGSSVELENLIVTAKNDPSRELDRVVQRTEIREFERPLWEAFDDVRRSGQDATPAQPQR